MLDFAAALATLAVLGAHAVVPWRLASPASGPDGEARRRAWGLLALPLLLAAVAAVAAVAAARPYAALGAGWGELALAGSVFRAAALLAAALAAADLVAALGHRRLEPAGWRLLAGFGLAALAAGCLALELHRAGSGPSWSPATVLLAAGGRLLLALAAGEAAAPGRPWLGPLAVPGLAAYWLALPPVLRALLLAEGLHWTALAAALLLGPAPWLPRRYRRTAVIAGVLLAALLVARAASLTPTLPLALPPAPPPR